MDRASYRDEIRFRLTGDVLEMELDDNSLDKVLDAALREIQRYICSTSIMTIPFSKCIDLSNLKQDEKKIKINSVVRIYRSEGYTAADGTNTADPLYYAQWNILSGAGNSLYNFADYVSNYLAWNQLLQVRNTLSTDLSFRYDKYTEKLYINTNGDIPEKITIEYVPRFESVEEIQSDYWVDMVMRMATALTKVTVGRIRTRYTQSNALWTQDGQQILDEGNNELNSLREYLAQNTQLIYGID